jgi:hypothetical protein
MQRICRNRSGTGAKLNGRIHEEITPEGRLAAVARSLALKMGEDYRRTSCGPEFPDYADYRKALAPYIRREILLARIDEARKSHYAAITSRVKELAAELAEVETTIPKEHRL